MRPGFLLPWISAKNFSVASEYYVASSFELLPFGPAPHYSSERRLESSDHLMSTLSGNATANSPSTFTDT